MFINLSTCLKRNLIVKLRNSNIHLGCHTFVIHALLFHMILHNVVLLYTLSVAVPLSYVYLLCNFQITIILPSHRRSPSRQWSACVSENISDGRRFVSDLITQHISLHFPAARNCQWLFKTKVYARNMAK